MKKLSMFLVSAFILIQQSYAIIASQRGLENYTITADVNISNVAAGIIFAAQDGNNYFMWQFNIENGTPRLRPHKWTNGGAACLYEKNLAAGTFAKDTWFTVKLEVTDKNTLKTYIDGNLVETTTGYDFSGGDLGFRASASGSNPEKAWYDNVKLESNGKVLMSDDFSSSTCAFNGGVREGGVLKVERNDHELYIWQQDITNVRKDYELTGKFKIEDISAGICFGVKDEGNFYMAQFNMESGSPKYRPHRWQGGGAYLLAGIDLTEKGFDSSFGDKEHTFRIVVSGGQKFSTYIDDILVDENREGDVGYEKIGFRADHAQNNTIEKCRFDDLKLTDTSSGAVLFNEDFQKGWNPFRGGRVVDGQIEIIGSTNVHHLVWMRDKKASDYTLRYIVEADVQIENDGVAFRFAENGDRYMMWAVNTKNLKDNMPVVRRHRYAPGLTFDDTKLGNHYNAEFLTSGMRHYTFEVLDKVVNTYIDGRLVDTYTDEDNILALGDVAVRTSHVGEDEKAWVDNLEVHEYLEDGTARTLVYEDFENDNSIFFTAGFAPFRKTEKNGSSVLYTAIGQGSDAYMRTVNQTTITISDAGYTTVVAPFDTDFSSTNLTAYIGSVVEDDVLKLEEVSQVPAGTAVIVKGEAGSYNLSRAGFGWSPLAGNLLLPALTEVEVTKSSTYYALGRKNGKTGFYAIKQGQKIPRGKAYLVLSGSAQSREFFMFGEDNDETYIEGLEDVTGRKDIIYNIAGQRMQKIQKGVNIVGGKKILY